MLAGALPTTHIIKPAIATLPDPDINEHLTMRTASLVGLRVPATSVVDFAGQRALVVEHCDRARIGDGLYRQGARRHPHLDHLRDGARRRGRDRRQDRAAQ